MVRFGSGFSSASSAVDAVEKAVTRAAQALGDAKPKLAIVFASVSYGDLPSALRSLRIRLGSVPVVGGTSGACVFGEGRCAERGVSVVLLGGDGLEVEVRNAPLDSVSLVETVPAAQEIAAAADAAARRGFPHYVALVFAPGVFVDGEALVAAVRKGAGARALLAGGLTGDDLTLDRPAVVVGDELRSDRVVVAGLFARRPIGIAARHGWRAVGPRRTVTRADGVILFELDGRPALDVWLEDVRAAGGAPPDELKDRTLYLANHYALGIDEGPSGGWRARSAQAAAAPADDGEERELVARTPVSIREDGAIQLSASLAEGTRVRVLHASRTDLLSASSRAAVAATERAGSPVAGALVLACSARLAALGETFHDEPRLIEESIAAPVAGACVFGEIARNVRDSDAFFNTTAVVVAFAS